MTAMKAYQTRNFNTGVRDVELRIVWDGIAFLGSFAEQTRLRPIRLPLVRLTCQISCQYMSMLANMSYIGPLQ